MSEYKEVEEIKQREKNEETLSDKLRDLLSNELLTDKLLKEHIKSLDHLLCEDIWDFIN